MQLTTSNQCTSQIFCQTNTVKYQFWNKTNTTDGTLTIDRTHMSNSCIKFSKKFSIDQKQNWSNTFKSYRPSTILAKWKGNSKSDWATLWAFTAHWHASYPKTKNSLCTWIISITQKTFVVQEKGHIQCKIIYWQTNLKILTVQVQETKMERVLSIRNGLGANQQFKELLKLYCAKI